MAAVQPTRDVRQRGVFVDYVLDWLRTEENMFSPSAEKWRHARRVQELLGYKAVQALGVVDVGDPMALLD